MSSNILVLQIQINYLKLFTIFVFMVFLDIFLFPYIHF